MAKAFCLLSGALIQTPFILEGLEVHASRMPENLDRVHGLMVPEAVMMRLEPDAENVEISEHGNPPRL